MPLFGRPGEQISYTVHDGPPGAPLLVLVHGFTASAVSFDANIKTLCERFTVVTAELLGHGDSDAPEDPAAYGPQKGVVRLLRLFGELGYGRVLLCGHSLGGALALRLALEAPEALSGLIIINSNSAAGTPEWRELVRPRMAEMAARVRAEGTAILRDTRLYPAHSKRLDERSRALLTRDFDRLTPQAVAGTAESLVIDVNAYEHIPELAVPTLVILGDRDTDFVGSAPGLVARMPAGVARLVRLEGAGHAANIEQPEAFAGAVFAFATEIGVLDALPRPAAAHRFGNTALTGAGTVLVVGGLALIAAAFFFSGGKSNRQQSLVAAAPASTPTVQAAVQPTDPPTPIELVAGTRSAGPGAGATAIPTVQPTPAAAPTLRPAATSTPVRAAATRPPATSTPTPTATPTSAPTPLPTATVTPAGPFARIAGGATRTSAGSTLTFADGSQPASELQREVWSVGAGAEIVDRSNPAAIRVSFPSAGCYSVSLTVTFQGRPQPYAASMVVAVGSVSCQS